jgi:hypothetical protein
LKSNPESLTAFPTTPESDTNTNKPSQRISNKKTFAEPELSSPVDVLDSTTYFQSTESGATN